MLEIGKINKLKVLRETDIAYLLIDEEENEVFLHKNELNKIAIEEDSFVDAFLYYDQKSRLAATLFKPNLVLGEKALLRVVSKVPNLGVFLDMGISKDLLLSKDELPNHEKYWPIPDDMVYVSLVVKGRMQAKLIKYNEFSNEKELLIGSDFEGFVQELGPVGIFVYTTNHDLILVRKDNLRKGYRLGEKVSGKVTYKSKKGYEGNISGFKEDVMITDGEFIIDYLNKNHGVINFTDKSSSEEIKEVLGLSRKAFKRAIGHLYKENKVTFKDGKTYLVK